MIDRISIEPSRFCTKGCSFCYNGSDRDGAVGFRAAELVELAADCAKHGVRFLSIGGGEPLEWEGLFEVLDALRGVMFRSFTTNGLPLEKDSTLATRIAVARPDKVHVSIHAPENPREVARVCKQVTELRELGVDTGVNLLVRKSRLTEARAAARSLWGAGIKNDRITYLPSRGIPDETPTPLELSTVASDNGTKAPFQSMSCLRECGRSERFVSIAADRTVAFCSYTVSRRPLRALTYSAILEAIGADDTLLGLAHCDTGLVRTLSAKRRLNRDEAQPSA